MKHILQFEDFVKPAETEKEKAEKIRKERLKKLNRIFNSSSFVIFKDRLTEEQIYKIKEHYSISKKMCEQGTSIQYFYDYEDAWHIHETDLTIEGDTHMNNFSMYDYLTKFVGLNSDIIDWND